MLLEPDQAPASTWLMSCRWPVMRASGLALLAGSHRNMVKSSEPLARRSGRPPLAASYLQRPRRMLG